MAGEVEESFSMNFQADSIHSGSISFGRFENEPLSWERRSSFSHNRYLEEVEKCSKPGSVIEKKAYFEAHFKKKGYFGIIPSTCHDGSDRETSENDSSERIGKPEDFESNDGHYVQFDEMSQEDFELDEGGLYVVEMEQGSHEDFEPNEDSHYVQFGEIPVDSDYHGKCGVNRYEIEDTVIECPMVPFSSLQMVSAMNNSNNLENANKISITFDEAHQSENETSNILSDNDKVITEVKKDDDDAASTDESSINMNMNVNESVWGIEETILRDPTTPSPKETKREPQLNSDVNNVRVQKSTSRSSEDPPRIPSRESPRRMNVEKNLSKHAIPTTYSASKTAKVSKNEEKLIREGKSENVSRVKKASESQPSVLKSASKGIQEAERLNQTFNSTKSNVKPRAAAFNFKCSERAERRKEFYMKLEEKLHAKEAEMNQMQAISQEKTQADIKKLRKSLNFKATPMPSFYRTTLPSQPQGNKSESNNTRSKKVQNKPKCPATGTDATLPLKLKMGNGQGADEAVTEKEQRSIWIEESAETNASEASFASPAPSNSVTSNRASGKKEEAKVSSQKHRVSDSCKGARYQNNEGNKSGKTAIHRNDMTRKGVKKVGLRSSSKSGNLAVRVAS
ncbi:protein WVD2-like 7 [Abrus precatorius]|uniref:Protein WVD2-like 7 n=1 Tax=Abrus precatorius TaxID=3816 RepID=A0A8B8KTB7_ABRPR|nr:protein WVD2-like 7 [Abrus precatorius]